MKTPTWTFEVLACPQCRGRLVPERRAGRGSGVVRCASCGPYPVLASVPVLVPQPAEWCQGFRESALAALAERGLADASAVEVLDAFAASAPRAEARAFGDDWTAAERTDVLAEEPLEGPASAALAALLGSAHRDAPDEWLLARVPPKATVLEVGCGAGHLSIRLAERAKRLVVTDLSLRAVLLAQTRARAQARAEVVGAVVDADALPFPADVAEVLVGEHVVDLISDVPEFVRRACFAAKRVLLTTPEPGLGLPDDATLERVARAQLVKVSERADGLPWLRHHSARHLELYLVQALALERRGPDARGRRR